MGKLRFTLTYLLFWIIIAFSCLLAENFSLLTVDHMGGMQMGSLFMLSFFIILLLVFYYILERKHNKIKIDTILLCTIATFVLFLHKLFDNFSPLFMMIAQYLIASALIGGMLLLISIFVSPISPRGWFEFYRSFTIPYIFLAGFYYYRVFSETKKQDALIKEIQNLQE